MTLVRARILRALLRRVRRCREISASISAFARGKFIGPICRGRARGLSKTDQRVSLAIASHELAVACSCAAVPAGPAIIDDQTEMVDLIGSNGR